jgi:hypothetical protein
MMIPNRGVLILLVLLGAHWASADERARPAARAREAASPAPLVQPTPRIADVEGAFARISACGEPMGAYTKRRIPAPWYSPSARNWFGFRNHFQGIQRVPNRNYVILSGSNQNAPMANLFVIRLSSRPANGGWDSNVRTGETPPESDALAATIAIDSVMWHAGGLSVLGTILAVPIYGTHPLHAKVVFYDIGDPEVPRRLRVEIDRPGEKAYAAALTRLPNGRVLAAVLSARDRRPRRVDFYLSRSSRLDDGFHSASTSWLASDVQARRGQHRNFSDFQGLSFVSQSDGRLYLVGFHNSMPSLPVIPGKDYADLYEVVFPTETTIADEPTLMTPSLTKVASRRFYCKDGYCNMDASAGIHVDLETLSLHVYAAAVWLHRDIIRFTAYGPASDRASRLGCSP